MADIPARRSALAEVYRAETCVPPAGQPGITLSDRVNLTLLDLRGDPANAEFTASAQSALGCALPLAPNTSARGPHCDILWLGPDEWLLVSSRVASIGETLPIAGGCLTDVSHGRTALTISGAHSRELLAKDCSLDLDARTFLPGHCAQSSLAHVGVLLHLPHAGGEFHLYCARSYAKYLWHSLAEGAREYGYGVAPPA